MGSCHEKELYFQLVAPQVKPLMSIRRTLHQPAAAVDPLPAPRAALAVWVEISGRVGFRI